MAVKDDRLHDGAVDADDDGAFGTLGCSSANPPAFVGSYEDAYIDEDGMLHGFPPFEALDSGMVLCPSLWHDECFYVYSALRWPTFVRKLEAALQEEPDSPAGDIGLQFRERAQRIIDDAPCMVSLEDGLIPIPADMYESCGIAAGERLAIIGNDDHLEVWSKPAYDRFMDSVDLSDLF